MDVSAGIEAEYHHKNNRVSINFNFLDLGNGQWLDWICFDEYVLYVC